MMQPMLSYDDANMWARNVGAGGATPAEWKRMIIRLRSAKRNVQKIMRRKEQGFLDLPFDRKGHATAIAMAKETRKRFTDLVVLGIGGSDLGARMLQQALVDPAKPVRGAMRVHFAGSSTDPDDLARLLRTLNIKKTCINIISKSGGTLEPMAAFDVFRERLEKSVGPAHVAEHIVATTDPINGSLRAMAKKMRYRTLPVPANVGGRFSVLSAVGLFPAAAMGVATEDLVSGARVSVDRFQDLSVVQSPSCRFAGLHALGAETRKQRTLVTVAYTQRLGECGRWIRQLVAESLGKKKNRQGKTVYAGMTPVSCIGPEDQHSQLQLWSEGPKDKLLTFIEVNRFDQDLSSTHGSFQRLIHEERRATAEALRREERPNGTLYLERLDARGMGELIVFFEIAIALLGELFDINAYDQPGVELMKRIFREGLEASSSTKRGA